MFFCNVVSGWDDAEWKQNFRIRKPTMSLSCASSSGPLSFRSTAWIFVCTRPSRVPPRSFGSAPHFSSFHIATPVFPPHSTTPVVLLSPHTRPRSAIFNPLFALKLVLNPTPDEGRTRMLNPV